jgi:hypothetical protein
MTARRAGVGAVTRWRTAGAGAATGGGSDGEASSRAGAVAATGGTAGGAEWPATGRSLGIGKLCFGETASFGGWESDGLADDALFLAGEEILAAVEFLAADEDDLGADEDDLGAAEDLGAVLAGEEVLAGAAACCGFSAEGAAGSEFASEKDRASVRAAETAVDSAVDRKGLCKGLARTRGLTAFLRCESMARID